MQRVPQRIRPDWRRRLDERGFNFHSIDDQGVDRTAETDRFLYWREDVAYRFTEAQVETLYEATMALQQLCLETAGDLIRRGDLDRLQIPPAAQAMVENSWQRGDPSLYGRFDLSWDGTGAPKLLEANHDTPTSLVESAVAQWWWKTDVQPRADQFNSLHEALVERWRLIGERLGIRRLHLACLFDSQEDVGNTEYLLDTALQAGLVGVMLDVRQIGVDAQGRFVDADDGEMRHVFKLYPWEWMVRDPYAAPLATAPTRWIEPPWKLVLSNKGLLPILWERHRGHPNLLPASFDPTSLADRPHVRKPLLSREGANIRFIEDGCVTLETPGGYGAEGWVYQALARVASFPAPETTSVHGPLPAVHAVLGSWVVGDEAVGLCVREDVSPVTKDTSYFVPHYFE